MAAATERYLYDCASDRAVFYEAENFLFPLASSDAAFRVDGDYVFCMKTERIAFWILGKQLYGHIENGELTRDPVYHYGD
ncbi:hypothetical protein A4U53_039450 (plasmid) [Rhizobium ruizarguesonis]|uniref:Uncharacterized protein n=2 Tax=Rhizobium TaxID=379 RepID=A0A179BPY5_RHILE|nr:hypothetical protein [Rhizobium leguminosarum]OAP93797.1 hypothetical protein A4U53_23870 [Rhizobium leguminosarum]